jgi:hypothetical protein
MRYFHRTSLGLDATLREADRYFAPPFRPVETGPRRRVFQGPVGQVRVEVQAEGGHYTLVSVATDQVGESEADKLAKRFLAVVHTRVEPRHAVRGAY